ncbi:hypothetical protein HDU76_012286, partial [Blyttiomyces sp. JEL0837]
MTSDLKKNLANLENDTNPFDLRIHHGDLISQDNDKRPEEKFGKLRKRHKSFRPSNLSLLDPSLSYACRYWISHVLASQDHSILAPLAAFCSHSLLHWIERAEVYRWST